MSDEVVHPGDGAEDSHSAVATIRDRIEATLRTVFDPEIPVNIYDLGLVYEIKVGDNAHVKITMTLTAPACPSSEAMPPTMVVW